MVIDSACLIKQSSCSSKGACLLYNNESFRLRLHGYVISFKSAALLLYIIGIIISWKNDKINTEKEKAKMEELQELNKKTEDLSLKS